MLGGGSHISTQTPETEDELRDLDRKIKQLKLDYERYFLGTRPREPFLLRSDVQKIMAILSNTAIQNTALRFKFSSICSRYQALKRQWDETLRKIEAGTYARHKFKAGISVLGIWRRGDLNRFDSVRLCRKAPGSTTGISKVSVESDLNFLMEQRPRWQLPAVATQLFYKPPRRSRRNGGETIDCTN